MPDSRSYHYNINDNSITLLLLIFCTNNLHDTPKTTCSAKKGLWALNHEHVRMRALLERRSQKSTSESSSSSKHSYSSLNSVEECAGLESTQEQERMHTIQQWLCEFVDTIRLLKYQNEQLSKEIVILRSQIDSKP